VWILQRVYTGELVLLPLINGSDKVSMKPLQKLAKVHWEYVRTDV
jgi:hypothetical protein